MHGIDHVYVIPVVIIKKMAWPLQEPYLFLPHKIITTLTLIVHNDRYIQYNAHISQQFLSVWVANLCL